MTDEEIPPRLKALMHTPTVAIANDDNDHPMQTGTNPEDVASPTTPDDALADTAPSVSPAYPSQIQYLVFSGGGAKAFAYLGALAALGDYGLVVNPTQQNVDLGGDPADDYYLNPERIKGVAGASAGAITAGLMASGVGLNQAYELLTADRDMKRFFDAASLSTVERPTLDGIEEESRSTAEQALVQMLMGPIDASLSGLREVRTSFLDYLAAKSGFEETVEAGLNPMEDVAQWMNANVTGRQLTDPSWWLGLLILSMDTGLPPSAVRKVLQTGQLPLYLAELVAHHGLFSGGYAREYLDEAIEAGLDTWGADSAADTTFSEFAAASPIDLAVVGADLESGAAGTFSTRHPPEASVADVIRLSMAIPFVYRPTAVERGPLAGTWVDGGLINNFPLHAFTPNDAAISQAVLGLRVDTEPQPIDGVGGFLGSVFDSLLTRTTTAQVRSDQEAAQVVSVPCGDLGTLSFLPSDEVLDKVLKNAAQAVFEYFGQRSETAVADAERVVRVRVYGERAESGGTRLPDEVSDSESDAESGESLDDSSGKSSGERERPWWMSQTSPKFPDLPERDSSIERYDKSYITRKFRSEMLEIIKAGRDEGDKWEPHPLAFLLDPQVKRGTAGPEVDNPDELVDPIANQEEYIAGVSYWPSQSPKEYYDWYFLQDYRRRVTVDAGHLVPRDYLEKDPYEYERLAFEDTYLNRQREASQEKEGVIPIKWAVEIAGVPVEIETARRLEIDVDLQEAGYYQMSDEEQSRFRRRYFPVDYDFPDWKPFGGVLGGLPKGTVDEKLANDEWTAGWIYVRGYDARRLPELDPEFR